MSKSDVSQIGPGNSSPPVATAGKSNQVTTQPKGVDPVFSSFEWPPKGKVGQIEFKFGKPQSWIDKQGWEVGVTWHQTPGKPLDYKGCKLEDWDRGGHACESSTAYLFNDEAKGEGRSLCLEKDGWRSGKSRMEFRKTPAGWMGCAILDSKDKNVGQGLFLVHLNDVGKATVGLWVPSKEKFYFANEKSFISDPNAPLKLTKEMTVPKGSVLPAPFQFHSKDLDKPVGIIPFCHKGQVHLKWNLDLQDGKAAWRIQDFVCGDGNKEFSLPLEGEKKVAAPSDGIFTKWERQKDCWVATSEEPGLPASFGLLDKSRLKLSLLDTGQAILTLGEERTGGEKRIYRLDPKWLSNLKGLPQVLSSKRLMNGENFDSVDFKSEAFNEANPFRFSQKDLPEIKPKLPAFCFGDVAL